MKRVMILSGAGLSAESGINTFRDHDGLWEEHNVMDVCSTQGWIKDRQLVTNFYNARRYDLAKAAPNYAHQVLAELQIKYRGRIIHLTQNVDNLLEQAGATDTIHLHGTLTDLRCEACTGLFDIGYAPQTGEEVCPHCGSRRIRHNVVMFGEASSEYMQLTEAIRHATMFVAIGTSGQVIDIVNIAKEFKHSLLLDPKRHHTKSMFDPKTYMDEYFQNYIQLAATKGIEAVRDHIEAHFATPRL